MTNPVIPAEAVEAAVRTMPEYTPEDEADSFDLKAHEVLRGKVEMILEAAAPHIIADHLLTLAADVKARGDIGKHGGLEAWDYLTWKAEQLRPAE